MSRNQLLSIAFFTALFLVLYFGCDTKSKENKALEKSRAQNLELVSIDRIVHESRDKLSARAQSELISIEQSVKTDAPDSIKLNQYKSLASLWYSEGYPLISGHFAELIAKIQNNEESWSICGTTYAIAGQRLEDQNQKQHAIQKSRSALENALSFDSENVNNKINLALSYVDAPDETNPMKGILMLIDLNKKFPDNTSVLFQLGRLALGTNQLDKAVERLSRVVELDPNNREAHCLLAETFEKKGEMSLAKQALEYCTNNKN